jgi:hypothetical protein
MWFYLAVTPAVKAIDVVPVEASTAAIRYRYGLRVVKPLSEEFIPPFPAGTLGGVAPAHTPAAELHAVVT